MRENYGSQYNAHYYQNYGRNNYNDKELWEPFFNSIAEKIVALFAPKTFLDVGCAYGYIVAALRDLGVEAYGVDVSEHAISQVREDIRPYCFVADVTQGLPEGLPDRFDCVSTIEVIEHLYEEDAQTFLTAVCARTDRVIFSSTPDDFQDKTHYNVQQQEYWVKRFASEGFLHDISKDMTFLSLQALCFIRQEKTKMKLIEDYERALRMEQYARKKEIAAVIETKDSYIQDLEKTRRNQEASLQAIIDVNKEEERKNRESNMTLQHECDDLARALSRARAREQELQLAYDGIANATFWKMTAPARRVVNRVKRMLGKGPRQSIQLQEFGPNAGTPLSFSGKMPVLPAAIYWKTLYCTAQPIPAIVCDEKVNRLNVVVDSISPTNLQGGVATSLIVAVLFAARQDMTLRIITRCAPANPLDLMHILELNGIEPPQHVEYYSDYDRDEKGDKVTKLPVTVDDVFMATSWWSAKAIEKTSLRKRFYYIIQEVENFFYPHGYEQLLCKQVMQSSDIDFIVNSHYLWEYFEKIEPNIIKNGVYFDPAFSKSLYHDKQFGVKTTQRKSRLFFYARPNNPRNLFAYGLMILDEAIKRGILDTAQWEICCAGQDIPDVIFCDGTRPHCLGQLSWDEYRDFVGSVDMALCLMYTPHPSYPPYDVAVSGGVVVTNSFLNKVSFEQCKNVIVADLDMERFMQSMKEGVQLAKDWQHREENYRQSAIPRDWAKTLERVMKKMEEWL